jgi:phage gpG-like protein
MFEIDSGALDALLFDEEGPIAMDLMRRGMQVANTAKRITRGPGGGRVYVRHGISHQAAAPGEPFASDTGRLSASITVEVERDALGLVCLVGSDVEYAALQEMGDSRMPAHPYLRPSLPAAAV